MGTILKWGKRALKWRKYRKAAQSVFDLAKEAQQAMEDGRLDEEEAMRLAQGLVTAAYDVEELL
jgi:hypothetical protein